MMSKYCMKRSLLVVVLVLLGLTGFSQTANIKGFVYDQESGEPIIFTNVVLKGTSIGASTDVNGYYSIAKVPPGNYIISVTYLGYDSLSIPISLKPNEILNKKLVIKKSSIKLNTVEISAERQEAKVEVKTSVIKVTPKEIKQIPTIGGEPDLAQYLQVLPGVVFTGDQGGQLYIRGGSAIQNKVLLDGMVIYNPFHSIGLFSVFDTDIIRNADIYTGGFGAQYGGRISSIMDIKTKDGNKKKLGGKVSASTFGAKVLLEGPLKKLKDDNKGSSSFIISAKNSYLDQSSKLFYSYIDSAGLPFAFNDLYGKVSFSSPTGSKVNLFGFRFDDRTRYKSVSDLSWVSYGGGTNFILIPNASSVLIDGVIAYSQYKISLEEANKSPRTSAINGFNFGLNFSYFENDNELKYGIEVLGFRTDFNFFNEYNREISQIDNTTEFGAYVKYKVVKGKFVFEPSFRAHYFASLSSLSPEPRFGMKYNITNKLRAKFSSGIYAQNLVQANSDRDVVNLFYGFLSGSDNVPKTFTTRDGEVRDVKHKLQKAQHAILGFEYDVNNRISLNVEGYFKNFSQLTNLNKNKIFEDTPNNNDRPEYQRKDFIIEDGKAYGVDFVFKYDYKRVYVWAVYSLMKVDRWDGLIKYAPVFDRRHNVNLVAAYTFGKKLNYEFNARWNFGTGFPFTPTQGYYESINFTGGISTDYTTVNGQLGTQLGEFGSKRLPTYHRMDVTLKRKFEVSINSTIEATLSVTNIYNRENIFYVDRITNDRVNQLPLMPSLGVNWVF